MLVQTSGAAGPRREKRETEVEVDGEDQPDAGAGGGGGPHYYPRLSNPGIGLSTGSLQVRK